MMALCLLTGPNNLVQHPNLYLMVECQYCGRYKRKLQHGTVVCCFFFIIFLHKEGVNCFTQDVIEFLHFLHVEQIVKVLKSLNVRKKIVGAHMCFAFACVVFLTTDCSPHYHLFAFSSVDTC